MVRVSIRESQRERKAEQARTAYLRKIVNTYGFASLGAAVGSMVFEAQSFGPGQVMGIVVGVAFHALALYLAPVVPEASDV